jgi:hypothetical protein
VSASQPPFTGHCILPITPAPRNRPSARFLWKRLPSHCKCDPELGRVWDLGKYLWNRKYEGMFDFIAASAGGFSPLTTAALTQFTNAHRQRSIALLSKAYTNIAPAAAAGFTGIPAEQITAAMIEAGWAEQGGALVAPPLAEIASGAAAASGMAQLQQLTEYIVRIDS